MFKVLIVDDNSYVVKSLATIINWPELECNVIGLAANGIEGKRLIMSKHPDIILTDIKMPGQDGLSMLESTKRFSTDSKIIVLSAYQKFEFAKRALKLNVIDYLTKPIDKNQLLKSIKKATELLTKEHLQSQHTDQINRNFQSFMRMKQEQCIFDLINFKFPSIEAAVEHFQNTGLNFTSFYYVAAKVNCKRKPAIELTNKLQDNLESLIQHRILCTYIEDKLVIWVFNGKRISYDKAIESIKPLVKILYEMQEKGYILRYVIAACLYKSVAKIPQAFCDLSKMLTKAAYRMNTSKTDNADNITDNTLDTQVMIEEYSSRLSLSDCKIEHIINELIEKLCKKYEYDDFSIKTALIHFVVHHINEMYGHNHDVQADIDAIMNEIKEIQNIEQAQKCLCKILDDIVNNMSTHQKVQYSFIVQKSLKYISQNVQKEISLDILSEELSVSPTYLSTIIKKETGRNFRDILVSERVEVAKKLLKNSDYSIENVANAVCYKNYINFYKVFKKNTGVSPKEYRDDIHNHVLGEHK